ncbi:Dihydroxyacetone synthase [Cyberlindnera fabianii]|uniref:transketolase n=1 Tax=Cyberlindnera fabianii TaxID=36022 RepID=A0A1V2L0Z8_CYBFA|nr:Dihydroxyacetone synthase [Cyberlindnera fabianii]
MTTTDIHDLALRSIRVLIADLVQQFNGGHPGGAMDMAAIGIALWKYTLQFSVNDPDYFNRDRFVLSNGHTCLFQYVFQHLVGYKHMTMDMLKTYHSTDPNSFCPGHPEIEIPGIEITTGALGQGITNAVGLAIAAKNLGATYNKEDFPVVSNHTFCMVGDACLQEGVTLEAISLAGHLGLNNLTVMYDNNQITCDGSVDLTNTEDINAKFNACNWDVIEVFNGSEDIDAIVAALAKSKTNKKPTLVNIHTRIGIGSNVEGQAAAHGAAFGQAEVDRLHQINDFPVEQKYHIPQPVYDFFSDIPAKGDAIKAQWEELLHNYTQKYPREGEELLRRIKGELPDNWESLIPETLPESATASRKASGLVFNPVAKEVNSFIVGTADLSPSVNMMWDKKSDFQNPNIQTACGQNGSYKGRYIHYGIREHAMAAISNGIAAYSKGTFIPVTSTFFMFYLYAAPAVRYGALSELQVIHVATHDSIGTGEDGPTHQPIALAALYRSMPNLLYIRPADNEEVAGAWKIAINAKNKVSILSLSRQTLTQYPQYSKRNEVAKGAYIFKDIENPQISIIGVGPEMKFAFDAAQKLNEQGIRTRLISFPCQTLFEKQSLEYKRKILQRGRIPTVVVEAYAPNGWERYATAGISMHSFGKSLPGAACYDFFGFNGDVIADEVKAYFKAVQEQPELMWEFQDLNTKGE